MKKTITFLVAALILVSMSLTVFADMGPPAFTEYEVYVTNPDGTVVKDYDENDNEIEVIIPFNAKLKVVEENSDGKSLYAVYKDEYYEVSADDVSKVIPTVAKANYKLSKTYEKVILNKSGAVLKSGPAESYHSVGKIPYGATVKSNYGTADSSYGAIWLCVTYNNVTGWLHCAEFGIQEDCASVYSGKDNEIQVLDKGCYLYGSPSSDKAITGDVPIGTKLKFNYTYNNHGQRYYVEYNGVKGWLQCNSYADNYISCAYPCDCGLYTIEKTKMYSKPMKGTPTGEIGTIPANEILCAVKKADYTVKYYEEDYTWYFIKYNGKESWVRTGVKESAVGINYLSEVKLAQGSTMLSKPDKSASPVCTIPKGTTIDDFEIYSDKIDGYMLAKYNGKFGWIKTSDKDEISIIDFNFNFSDYYEKKSGTANAITKKAETTSATTSTTTTVIAESDTIDAPTIKPADSKVNNNDSDNKAANERVNPKVIIISCICGAVILAVTAAVSIKLIKKKKGQNDIDNNITE